MKVYLVLMVVAVWSSAVSESAAVKNRAHDTYNLDFQEDSPLPDDDYEEPNPNDIHDLESIDQFRRLRTADHKGQKRDKKPSGWHKKKISRLFVPECPVNTPYSDAICLLAPVIGGYRCYCVPFDIVNSRTEAESVCGNLEAGGTPMKLASLMTQYDIVQISQVLAKPIGSDLHHHRFWTSAEYDDSQKRYVWDDQTAVDVTSMCQHVGSSPPPVRTYLDTKLQCIRPYDETEDVPRVLCYA